MNWLDSKNIDFGNLDEYMWDQLDLRDYTLRNFEGSLQSQIGEMADLFCKGNDGLVVEIDEPLEVVDFPGPMDRSHLIKSVRKG
jgi:hypothetical protein